MTNTVDSVPASVKQKAAPKATKSSSGGLGRYILLRGLLIIPTVFIVVTVVFLLMRTTGDPITAAVGGRLPADQLQERIAAAGYDRPLIVQYLDYILGLFRGDFGTTITDNRPVLEVIASYSSASIELAFYALLVAFVVGIPLGMAAAYFRDRWRDAALRVFAILCYATPVFFAGLLLKLIFSVWLDILPVSGRASTSAEIQMELLPHSTGFYTIDAFMTGDPEVIGDVLSHVILPAIALGLLIAGVFLRLVRTNLIGTLATNYVDAARSRGVGEYRLISKHAYRPALIPIITVIGMQIAMLLGGAVLTETTFEWKGLGFLLTQYLQARDFVAVQGIVVLLSIIVALTSFIVDILAAFIDPRVRYS